MSDWLSKARRDYSNFNLSNLSAAGWLLVLASAGVMVGTGAAAFPYLGDRMKGGEKLAAVLCIAAGVAAYRVGRNLLTAAGISVRQVIPTVEGQSEAEAQAAYYAHRYARARGWFRFWLALMPAGIVIPLGVMTRVEGNTAEEMCLLAAVFVPCAGLVGALLMAGDRSRYRRVAQVAAWASRTGLAFSAEPPEDEYEWVRGFPGCNGEGDYSGCNLVTGTADGRKIAALDFTFQQHPGRQSAVTRQSVVVVVDDAPGVPDFCLGPKGWLAGPPHGAGDRAVDLPDQPEFARRFALFGPDPGKIAACFGPEAVRLCLAEPDLSVETREGMLAVYQAGKELSPERLPAVGTHATRLAAALRSDQAPAAAD